MEQRLRGFFERRMRAQGRRAFVHHVTGWPRAGFLQAVFPDARFVHVLRDVPYEDILAEPRKQFATILEFLGLEWTPRFEAGFARHHFATGRSAAFRRDLDRANLAMLEHSLAGRLLAYDYPLTPQETPS
jgi:hypothetical protein